MRLHRFPARLAVAFVVTAAMLLAHARTHTQLLLALALVGLAAWAALEVRHLVRQRRDLPAPRGH